MKRVERLDQATAPDGTVLTLYRRDGDYWIQTGSIELMSTRRHHSEEQLAERVCTRLRTQPGPRVLIGGLGFGFTLRAALRILPPDARVSVAEIVGAVIDWNRNPQYPLASDALDDPRVLLHHGDVLEVLRNNHAEFDAIMLDVDNGAEALTTSSNSRLYTSRGIRLAISALRPGGWLAYWSADPDSRFSSALRQQGLTVEEVRVRAHTTAGAKHTLLLARSPT
jgi:spermidine synthase